MTLQLLWFEYKERYPDGYQYSQFCERYRLWSGKLDLVMRQEHRAGEKAFVLAPLRNRTFFNLAELNRAIRQLVDKLNDKPFQKLEGSRRSLFEELDRPALKRLPDRRYEFAECSP